MTGAELIAQERQRQVQEEGWTPEHDDEHDEFQLSKAAVCYAEIASQVGKMHSTFFTEVPYWLSEYWPWETEFWKPDPDPLRNLVKAGALIAAEIDRLQRMDP